MFTIQPSMAKAFPDRLLEPHEVTVLEAILTDAHRRAGISGFAQLNSELSLLDVLRSYETVLQRSGIDSKRDVFYHKCVMKLSTMTEPDWWVRLETLKAENANFFGRQNVSQPISNLSSSIRQGQSQNRHSPYKVHWSNATIPPNHEKSDQTFTSSPSRSSLRMSHLTPESVVSPSHVTHHFNDHPPIALHDDTNRYKMWQFSQPSTVTSHLSAYNNFKNTKNQSYPIMDAPQDVSDGESSDTEVAFAEFHLMARTFRAWYKVVVNSNTHAERLASNIREGLEGVASTHQQNLMRFAFFSWRENMWQLRREREAAMQALTHWANNTMRTYFFTWRRHIIELRPDPLYHPAQIRALHHWIILCLPDKGDSWVHELSLQFGQRSPSRDIHDTELSTQRTLFGASFLTSSMDQSSSPSLIHHQDNESIHKTPSPSRNQPVGIESSITVSSPLLFASPQQAALASQHKHVERELFIQRFSTISQSLLRRILPFKRRLPLLEHASAIRDADTMARVLLQWRSYTESVRHVRYRAMLRCLQATFDTWSKYTFIQKQKEIKIATCHQQSQSIRLLSVIRTWHTWSNTNIIQKKISNELKHKRHTKIMQGSMRVWQSRCICQRSLREIQTKTTQTLLHSILIQWRQQIQIIRSMRERQNTVLSAIHRLRRTRIFHTWYHTMKAMQQSQRHFEQKQKQLVICRWFSMTRECHLNRDKYASAVLHARHKQLYATFSTWYAKIHQQKKMRQVIYLWQSRQIRYSFHHWIKWHTQQIQHDQVAVRHIQESILHRMLTQWKQRFQTRRMLTKVIQRWQTQQLSKVFVQWQSYVQNSKHKDLLQQKATSHWTNHVLKSYLCTWQTYTNTQQKIRIVLQHWQQQRLSQGLHSWYEWCCVRQQHRDAMYNAVITWKNGNISKAIRTWYQWMEHRRKTRAIVSRVVHLWRHQDISRAFITWKFYTQEKIQSRHTMKIAYNHFKTSAAKHAINRWHTVVKQHHSKLESFERVIKIFRHTLQAKAFRRWAFYRTERQTQKQIAYRVVNTMRHIHQVRVIWRWFEWTQARNHSRKTLAHVSKRLQNLKVAQAFDSLRWYTKRQVEIRQREIYATESLQVLRIRQSLYHWHSKTSSHVQQTTLMRKIILRLKFIHAAHAIDRWREWMATRKHCRNISKQVIQRLQFSQTYRFLAQWRAWTKHRRHNIMLVEKVIHRIQQLRVSTAFDGWIDTIRQQKRNRELMMHAIVQLTNARMIQSIQVWHRITKKRIHNRAVLTRAIQTISHSQSAIAFKTWKYTVSEKKRRRQIMETVMFHMEYRHVFAAVRHWHTYTFETIRIRKVQQTVIESLLTARTRSAIQTWIDWHQQRMYNRTLLQQSVVFFTSQKVASAVRQWITWTVDQQTRRKNMMAVVHKLQNRAIYHTVRRWIHWTNQRQISRAQLHKVIKTLRFGRARTFIHQWQEWKRKRQQMREMMQHVVHILKHGKVASAVQKWRTWSMEQQKQNQLKQKVTTVLQNIPVWSAWLAWKSFVKIKQRQRTVLNYTATRFMMGRVGCFVIHWRTWTQKRMENREQLLVAINRCRNVSLHKALVSWHEWTKKRIQMSHSAYQVVTRLMNLKQAKALTQWRSVTDSQKTNRQKLGRAISCWQNRTMATSFATWHQVYTENKHERTLLQKAIVKWQMNGALQAIHRWRLYTQQQLSMRHVILRFQHYKIFHAIHTWRTVVQKRKEQRKGARTLVKLFFGSYQTYIFHSYFHRIRQFTIKSRTRRLQSSFIKLQQQMNTLKQSFRRWHVSLKAIEYRRRRVSENVMLQWKYAVLLFKEERIEMTEFWTRAQMYQTHSHITNDPNKYSLAQFAEKSIRRWKHIDIAPAFSTWEYFAKHRREKRLANIMARNTYRRNLLIKAMKSWKWFISLRQRQTILQISLDRTHAHQILCAWKQLYIKNQVWYVREEQLTILADQHLQQSYYRTTFHRWYKYTMHRHRLRMNLTMFIRRWRHRRVAAAMVVWKHYIIQRREIYQVASILSRDAYKENLRERFIRWRRYSTEIHRRRMQITQTIYMWQQKHVAQVFRTWKSNVQVIQYQRRAVMHVICAWQNTLLTSVFHRWRQFTRQQQQDHSRKRLVISRLQNLHVSRALSTWHSVMNESKRIRSIQINVIQRWTHSHLSKAISRWYSWTNIRVEQRQNMLRAIHVWQNQSIYHSLYRWLEWTKSRQQAYYKLEDAICHMQNYHATNVLQKWNNFVQSRQKRRMQLQQAILQWQHVKEAQWFANWKLYTSQHKNRREIMLKTISNLQNRSLTFAVRRWIEFSKSRIQHRTIAIHAIHKLKNVSLTKGLNRWIEYAQIRQRNRMNLQKAIQQWESCHIRQVFITWAEYTNEMIQYRDITLTEMAETQNTRRTLRTVFDSWHTVTRAKVSRQVQMDRAIMYFRYSHTIKAINQWRHWTCTRYTRRATLQNVINHLQHGALYRAIASWRQSVQEKRTRYSIMSRAVNHLCFHRQFKALHTWKEWNANRQQEKHKLCVALNMWRSKVLVESFHVWYRNATEQRYKKLLHARSVTFAYTKRIEYVQKCIATWAIHTAVARRSRTMRAQAILLNHIHCLRRTFSAWRSNAYNAAHERQQIVLGRAHVLHGQVQRAFSVWHEYTVHAIKYRASVEAEQHMKLRMERRIIWLREKLMRQTFHQWAHNVQRRRQLVFIRQRFEMSNIHRYFAAWRHYTRHMKMIRSKQIEAVHTRCQRLAQNAVITWKAWTTRQYLLHETEQTLLQRHCHKQLRILFYRWKHEMVIRRRSRTLAIQKLEQTIHGVRIHRFHLALLEWRTRLHKKRTYRTIISRFSRNKRLLRGLKVWKRTTWRTEIKRRQNAKAIRFNMQRLKRMVFSTWCGMVFRDTQSFLTESLSNLDDLRSISTFHDPQYNETISSSKQQTSIRQPNSSRTNAYRQDTIPFDPNAIGSTRSAMSLNTMHKEERNNRNTQELTARVFVPTDIYEDWNLLNNSFHHNNTHSGTHSRDARSNSVQMLHARDLSTAPTNKSVFPTDMPNTMKNNHASQLSNGFHTINSSRPRWYTESLDSQSTRDNLRLRTNDLNMSPTPLTTATLEAPVDSISPCNAQGRRMSYVSGNSQHKDSRSPAYEYRFAETSLKHAFMDDTSHASQPVRKLFRNDRPNKQENISSSQYSKGLLRSYGTVDTEAFADAIEQDLMR